MDSFIELLLFNLHLQKMDIIEGVGFVTGIAAVYLLYKDHILTWPVGFINIGCFMWMFWQQKLYGDFIVQLIFLTSGIWGWANWNQKTLKNPSKFTNPNRVIWIILTILITPFTTYYLKNYTDCSYPIAEATILSLSIFGQGLTALHKIENWYWWLVADFLMIIVYAKKELYLTSVYAAIIFVIGIFGILSWNKLLTKSSSN